MSCPKLKALFFSLPKAIQMKIKENSIYTEKLKYIKYTLINKLENSAKEVSLGYQNSWIKLDLQTNIRPYHTTHYVFAVRDKCLNQSLPIRGQAVQHTIKPQKKKTKTA